MTLGRLLAARSGADILNALAPLGGIEQRRDIPFGAHVRLRLDVYAPKRPRSGAATVVFLYGGGWDSGQKSLYPFLGAALARRGITTVIPDYRVFPEVRFPDFLRDAAKAVRWTVAQLCRDGRRPVLMGHSAGAHIAAMLTFDGQWLAAEGLDPRRDVAGLVGLAGPYDFLPLQSQRLRDILGPEEGLAATQPINFVNPHLPPVLLAAGRRDRVVDPANSTRLARKIAAAGGDVALRLYPWAAHASLIGAFALPLRPLAPVLRDSIRFVEAATAPGAAALQPEEAMAC